MTADTSRQAVVEAALVLLERMGLSPADLAAVPQPREQVPTFAEYVPVVSAAVSAGTHRAYGSYWTRRWLDKACSAYARWPRRFQAGAALPGHAGRAQGLLRRRSGTNHITATAANKA
jgi:hypothetical protein